MTLHRFDSASLTVLVWQLVASFAHPLWLAVRLCIIAGFVKPVSAHTAHRHVILGMVSVLWEMTVRIHCKVFYLHWLGHYSSLPLEWEYFHSPVWEAVLSHLPLVIYTWRWIHSMARGSSVGKWEQATICSSHLNVNIHVVKCDFAISSLFL